MHDGFVSTEFCIGLPSCIYNRGCICAASHRKSSGCMDSVVHLMLRFCLWELQAITVWASLPLSSCLSSAGCFSTLEALL